MISVVFAFFALVSSRRLEHHEVYETNSSRYDLPVTPFSDFDPENPRLSSETGEIQVFQIVEKPKFGKLPDYEVFHIGTPGARREPTLVYTHDNKFLALDVNIKGPTGEAVLEWRAYRTMSSKAQAKAFLTSPGRGMWRETYSTITQLTKWGARSAQKSNQLGHLSASWLSTAETFTIDAGRCPTSTHKMCGKRLINAQGDKMGNWVRMYTPDSTAPVAVLGKTDRKFTLLGRADSYELTVQPGQDPLLLMQLACFIDAANNIEAAQDS